MLLLFFGKLVIGSEMSQSINSNKWKFSWLSLVHTVWNRPVYWTHFHIPCRSECIFENSWEWYALITYKTKLTLLISIYPVDNNKSKFEQIMLQFCKIYHNVTKCNYEIDNGWPKDCLGYGSCQSSGQPPTSE